MTPEERIKELEQEVAILKARDSRVWGYRYQIGLLLDELNESLKNLEKKIRHGMAGEPWKMSPDESGDWWFHGEINPEWVAVYVDNPARFDAPGAWVKKVNDTPPPPLRISPADILDVGLYIKQQNAIQYHSNRV